jgi:hypothetical protein
VATPITISKASVVAGSASGAIVGDLATSVAGLTLSVLSGPFTINGSSQLVTSSTTGSIGTTQTARIRAARTTPFLEVDEDFVITAIAAITPVNTIRPNLTGTARAGQTLSVTNGTWTGTPTGYVYAWFRDGVTVAGATANTYVLSAADIGFVITAVITAANTAGSTPAISNSTATINSAPTAPVNTGLPVITGSPIAGQVLTASVGAWTQSPTGYTYAWYRAGAPISGATAATYTLVTADVTKTISVKVTATNAIGSTTATSAATAVIGAALTAPVNSVAPVISGTTTQGQVLSVSTGTWSPSPTGYTYQWKRAGSAISGATASTYTLVLADVGAVVTCTVTASNGAGSASATSAATAAIAAAPVAPANTVAPAVTGTTTQGQVLTVSNGTWTGSPTGYTYQWKRAGVPISGASASTYALVLADVGQTLTCVVTATNGAGSASASSAATSAIAAAPAAPSNTVAPAITGTPTEGQVLTVSNGTWTASPTGYAYQWKRDGTNISGATASTYTLVTADVSHAITCTVTATNGAGSTAATSAATATIAAATAGTRYIPATQVVDIGRLTMVGHGVELGYTHPTGHLTLVSSTGNGAQMYRVNGANQLVRGGTKSGPSGETNFGVAHLRYDYVMLDNTAASGTLATSYDMVVQCSATGQQSAFTVYNSRVTSLAAFTQASDPNWSATLPALTVDWSKARSVMESRLDDARFPSTNDDDYFSNSNSLGSGGVSQLAFNVACYDSTRNLGDFLILEPGSYNPPVYDATLNSGAGGTAWWDIRPNVDKPAGTFSGTGPEYNDGNWYTVAQRDPLNTTWGNFLFGADGDSCHRFTHGYWKMERASFWRVARTALFTGGASSASGILSFNLGATIRKLKIDNNYFESKLPWGETEFNDLNCAMGFYMVHNDGAADGGDVIVTDNRFTWGLRAGTATARYTYIDGFVLKRNVVEGLHMEDCFHFGNVVGKDFDLNFTCSGPSASGAHPDHYQMSLYNDGDSRYGGVIQRLAMLTGDTGLHPTTGLPAHGYRVAGDESGQGLFLDSYGSTVLYGLQISNIFYDGSLANAIAPGYAYTAGLKINHVTVVKDQLNPAGDTPCINIGGGPGAITNSILTDRASQGSFTETAVYRLTDTAQTANLWNNPRFMGAQRSIAEVLADFKVKAAFSAVIGTGTDGRDLGAINHLGAWAADVVAFDRTTPAPYNIVAPSISGTSREGSTLTATPGTWLYSPTSYSYQWQRDGSAISGATASTYALVTADVGHTVACAVTATNGVGSTSATSGPTSTIVSISFVTPAVGTPVPQFSANITSRTSTPSAANLAVIKGGDFVYFRVGVQGASITGVADNHGNTWAPYNNDGRYGMNTKSFGMIAPGSIGATQYAVGDLVVTATLSNGNQCILLGFSCAGIVSPASDAYDVTAANGDYFTGTAISETSGTLTTGPAHTLCVGTLTYSDYGYGYTEDTAGGWTQMASDDNGTDTDWQYGIAVKVVDPSVSTTVTYAPTIGASRAGIIILEAFKGAA